MADKLYIGSELLDCDGLEYPVDLAIFDIEEFDTRKANKSKIIRVPATENNQQILGRLQDVAINPTLTGLEGRLVKNGFELKGRVIIHDIERDATGTWFNLQIVSGNGDWVQQLKGKMLTDLTMASIEHEYNETNINDSETAGGDYLYPLINYGQFQGGDVGAEVIVEDRLPAVKIWAIVQQIFKEIGYKITSTYCNLAAFSKWFMTYGRDPNLYTQEFCDDKLFRVGLTASDEESQTISNSGSPHTILLFSGANNKVIPFNADSSDPEFDNGANFNTTTHIFTADADMWCRFKVSVECVLSFPPPLEDVDPVFTVEILNGADVVASDTDDTYVFDSADISYRTILTCDTKYIYLATNDEIKVRITVTGTIANNNVTIDEDLIFSVVDSENTWFKNLMIRRPGRGYDWTVPYLLPDISQVDFLKAVFHIFNLMPATNPRERTVYIEQFGDFFNQTLVSWSGKLDTSKPIAIKGKDIPTWINYRMRLDGNDSQIINYITEVELSNGNGESKESNNELFADTLLDYCRVIGLVSVRIPKLWNKRDEYPDIPEQSMVFAPRLLYYDGQTALPSGETWTFNDDTMTTYPKFTAYNFATFVAYRTALHRMMNNSQVLQAYFRLTHVDVNNLANAITGKDFRSKIYLDDARYKGQYIINKIDGFRDDALQMVELLQARQLATGITTRQVQVTDTGGSAGSGGGGTTASGSSAVTCSHLITDAAVIAEITDETKWNTSGNFAGNTAGMAEGDYYVDFICKIHYRYDGTHLVRFNINAVL